MINKNELRLGNYVHYFDDTVATVNRLCPIFIGVNFYDDYNYCGDTDVLVRDEENRVKPITFSEDWLPKLGFIGNQKSGFIKKQLLVKGGLAYIQDVQTGQFTYMYLIDDIHTLQNLYHSLFDEELTINESINQK